MFIIKDLKTQKNLDQRLQISKIIIKGLKTQNMVIFKISEMTMIGNEKSQGGGRIRTTVW